MSFGSILEAALRNTGYAAEQIFETAAELITGSPHPLRDGTEHEAVELPRDLAAHRTVQTEWWYYTGHFRTESGKWFGFELVFFKRRTDLDKFSVVPVRLIGNPFYFAHFAIVDHQLKTFRYAHRKSANRPFDHPASASESHYYLRLGDWTARESRGMHILRASIGSKIIFEATLNPTKKVVLNGESGVSFKDAGEASRYFSYTRMSVDGDITIDESTEHFSGTAWMDREFGTWAPTDNQKGWDWFSIQLENETELMCYQLRNGAGEVSPYSSGVFVDRSGNTGKLTSSDFEIEPTGRWRSGKTDAEYPSGWRIRVPKADLELEVEPVIRNQELDTRGTTMIVYWEGSCAVRGSFKGQPVKGRAYVELVGYDRSHEQPNLATFLIGPPLKNLADLFQR